MIYTKDDLKFYLNEDRKQFGDNIPGFKDWLLQNERWYIYRFKRELRFVEYFINIKPVGGGKETYALLALSLI